MKYVTLLIVTKRLGDLFSNDFYSIFISFLHLSGLFFLSSQDKSCFHSITLSYIDKYKKKCTSSAVQPNTGPWKGVQSLVQKYPIWLITLFG